MWPINNNFNVCKPFIFLRIPRPLIGTLNELSSILSEITEKTYTLVKHNFFETVFHDELSWRIYSNSHLWIKDETCSLREELLGIIGKGGSKKAILLNRGRVLIIPNFDVDNPETVRARWSRMVTEEVAMSNILQSIDLLSPENKKVMVSLSSEVTEDSIPAYICESFKNMGSTKKLFIIDRKNNESSTWQGSLFPNQEDRLDEKKWDSVIEDLLTDIAKIFIYNIPVGGDSLNLSIQSTQKDRSPTPYKARYFGFDFSVKSDFLTLPNLNKILHKPDRDAVHRVVNILVNQLINHEFKGMKNADAAFNQFFDRLEQKYTDQVLLQIEKMLES